MDRLLRFDKITDKLYEEERGPARRTYLSAVALFGAVLASAYYIFGLFAFTDTPFFAIAGLCCLNFAMASLAIVAVHYTGHVVREIFLLFGMIGLLTGPAFTLTAGSELMAYFLYTAFSFQMMYAGLVLVMRFRYAILFAVYALALLLVLIALDANVGAEVMGILIAQVIVAFVFASVGNYFIEWQRCKDYLLTLEERERVRVAHDKIRHAEKASRTDPLTGLANRRALDEHLEAMFFETNDAAVFMIDLDYFKSYNDSLGHAEGDTCLREVAAILDTFALENDGLAGRFGGEEFVLLFAGLTELEAAQRARDLVHRVAEANLPHRARPDGLGRVTISLGVGVKTANEDKTVTQVMREADGAVYHAKRKGRNRFSVAATGEVTAFAAETA